MIYDDAALLQRLALRDEAAMEIIFSKYYSRLCFFAQKLTGSGLAAEDIAQETLIALWMQNQEESKLALRNLEAYLFGATRNKCYNYNQHLKMKTGKEEAIKEKGLLTEEDIETQLIREDIFNKIYQEIQQLPPPQLALVKMIYLEELDTAEIARRLAITPNNVRNQKARVLEKIRTLLLRKRLWIPFLIFLLHFL